MFLVLCLLYLFSSTCFSVSVDKRMMPLTPFTNTLVPGVSSTFHQALGLLSPEYQAKITYTLFSNPEWSSHINALIDYYKGNPQQLAKHLQTRVADEL